MYKVEKDLLFLNAHIYHAMKTSQEYFQNIYVHNYPTFWKYGEATRVISKPSSSGHQGASAGDPVGNPEGCCRPISRGPRKPSP